MPVTKKFVLADLLAHPELGLELVSGGGRAAQRRIAGAHAIEVVHPGHWLDRDWIMLTTGLALESKPRRQRDLIPELEQAGVAALGFGTGVVFDEIPAPLLNAARRHNFPVFTI